MLSFIRVTTLRVSSEQQNSDYNISLPWFTYKGTLGMNVSLQMPMKGEGSTVSTFGPQPAQLLFQEAVCMTNARLTAWPVSIMLPVPTVRPQATLVAMSSPQSKPTL